MRLGLGEIDAARDGTLPAVVELGDLRGDFHMHSTYSDGANTLEAMIAAAAGRGYEYHAIMRSFTVRSTRRRPRRRTPLRAQREQVRSFGRAATASARLCASEVDIRPDGSLDCSTTRCWRSSTS